MKIPLEMFLKGKGTCYFNGKKCPRANLSQLLSKSELHKSLFQTLCDCIFLGVHLTAIEITPHLASE